jgi:THO complex subunit 2
LPAVSLTDRDPPATVELWRLLSLLDHATRFAFYGEWRQLYQKLPELQLRKSQVERDARDYMRRLSTETVKVMGKNLAKLAHSNPLVLFDVMLNQVMSYDNFIGPASDATRYLGSFESDTLQYTIIETFANREKGHYKEDLTSHSLWLSSTFLSSLTFDFYLFLTFDLPSGLSAFVATLFRRSLFTPTLTLEYLVHRLEANSTNDLIILRETITRMTGISPISDLTPQQIRALGGGRSLRADVLTPCETRPALKFGQLLRASLEGDLAPRLLIHVALARQTCIHLQPETESNLKHLGNLFDQARVLNIGICPVY